MNFLILAILTSSCGAFAETWITGANGPHSSAQESEQTEKLKAQRPQLIAISAYRALLDWDISPHKIFQIRQMYKDAESLFYANKFSQSENKFSRVIDETSKHPLRGRLADVITKSRIRIAQIAEVKHSPGAAVFWDLAVASNPLMVLNDAEYPPLVRSKWKSVLEKQTHLSISLQLQMPFAGAVYLDGKLKTETQAEPVFVLLPGQHQISVLLPGANWWTKAVEVTQSRIEQIRPTPLVGGNCSQPEYLGPPLQKGTQMLSIFEDGCERAFDGHEWVKADIHPSFQPAYSSGELEAPFEKPSFISKLAHSPWFWIGTTLLAGGVYYLTSQEDEKANGPKPVHVSN